MTTCGQNCTASPYIKVWKQIDLKDNKQWTINKTLNCKSYNEVYLIECDKDKWSQIYIGETGRILKFRLDEHRGYINTQDESQATGLHFNLPGHSLANLKVSILEQVKINNEQYRKERESFYIRKLNTFYRGMNKQK